VIAISPFSEEYTRRRKVKGLEFKPQKGDIQSLFEEIIED